MKRGIVELADIVVVNKADGALKTVAEQTAVDYGLALMAQKRTDGGESPPVRTCSALTGEGLPEVWRAIEEYCTAMRDAGRLEARRAEQRRKWLWTETAEDLLEALRRDPRVKTELPRIERAVVAGQVLPMTAARHLLNVFLQGKAGA